jgi:Ca2+-binding EF-hand superfamily protein
MDSNKDGMIQFSEFLTNMICFDEKSRKQQIKKLFSLMDEDKSGYIEPKEVLGLFKNMGGDKKLQDEIINRFM